MYERVKSSLLWLLKVPPEPTDPMGDVQSLRVFRAAPGYLSYISVGWCIAQASVLFGLVLAVTPLVIASQASEWTAILVPVLSGFVFLVYLAQAAVSYFALRLNYEMRWYKVTDRSLRIRSGVWSVHEMTMTFANVQNISVTQGPLERLFGITDVRVETAGGGHSGGSHSKGDGLAPNLHVAVFRGVDNPQEIRDLMLERLRRLRSAGLGDLDDAPDTTGPETILELLTALRDEARALHEGIRP
jgi:membrane protein YdbS with pleckstrin-like domain